MSELFLHKSQSAKTIVGRIQKNNLNYPRDMHAFDSSEVPERARKAAEEMRNFVSADILGLKPPSWNKSTYVDRVRQYSEQLLPARKNFEIRVGLQDYTIPKQRPNKIYQGTETRNDFTGWNVSTFVEKNEIKKKIEEL